MSMSGDEIVQEGEETTSDKVWRLCLGEEVIVCDPVGNTCP